MVYRHCLADQVSFPPLHLGSSHNYIDCESQTLDVPFTYTPYTSWPSSLTCDLERCHHFNAILNFFWGEPHLIWVVSVNIKKKNRSFTEYVALNTIKLCLFSQIERLEQSRSRCQRFGLLPALGTDDLYLVKRLWYLRRGTSRYLLKLSRYFED